MRVALVAASLVIGALAFHGALVLAGGGSYDSTAARLLYGLMQLVVAAALAIGLFISAGRRRLGIALIVVSVAVLSALWYWFLIVMVPAGVALVVLAHRRGRATPSRMPTA